MPTGKSWTTSRNRFGNYGHTGGSRGTRSAGGYRSTTTRSGGGTPTWSCNTPQFNTIKDTCESRIGSYRTIQSQFNGSKTTFSPSTANKWVKFVNSGCCVYKFNSTQCARWFGSNWNNNNSPTQAFRSFRSRFGTGIKAVCRGNANTWLVCATPNVSSAPFRNYTWK